MARSTDGFEAHLFLNMIEKGSIKGAVLNCSHL